MGSVLRDLRSRRFWTAFATQTFAFFGALAATGGVVGLFLPTFFVGAGWIGWAGLGASALFGLARAWPQPIVTTYQAPATTIRLVRGDLFEQHDSHLVVGVSDTFDTASPHIATSSVQGQFLQRMYDNDLHKLDADLEHALAKVEAIEVIEGKGGKDRRYPLGTTVTLRSNAVRYFLVAYTQMDAHSTASSTTDGVWNSLSELWRVVRRDSNGTRVCIPLIGGGQSKLSPILPAIDSVRFIALSFMLASRTARVCDELAIVVPAEQYDALDHLEIQAFLRSLGPS